jgi:K+-dependent Na+/Ca+ exchanger-like protein
MLPFLDALSHPWREAAYAVAFLMGLALLERGADWFVDTAAALAKRLRAPQTLVGLLTAGGEWEELVVVLAAVFAGHGGIALGDIVGSTIANILGSFPLGLFGRKPLVVERSAQLYALVLVGITALVAGLLVAGPITRPLGGALVGLFVLYLASILLALRRGLLHRSVLPADEAQSGGKGDEEDEEEREEEEMERQPPLAQVAFLVGGLGLVALGAVLVVEPAVYFAHLLGLSEAVIGLTIVAVGTTLPDKAISLAGGLKARGGIVVANAVGSNIFVLTLVLGVSAIAAPVVADTQTLRFDVPVMFACALLLCLLVFRGRLHWRTGIALLTLYVGYLVSQFALK